jgi:tripartite-type tricarboxylate transporter receptor subunit TctC
MVTPKVPDDRVAVLADAFDKAFKDPMLWEQMEKVGEFLRLLSRPQIEQMVARQAIEIEKYKDVLG